MRWTDIYDIALDLEDKHGEVDILGLRFTELKRFVLELENFNDAPEKSNEKVLEAIQMAWLKERNG